MTPTKIHNPARAPPVSGGYSQGVEVSTPGRFLYISGQIPEHRTGDLPARFEDQCRQVWSNIEVVLASAGMTVDDLVKVTTFLSDREYRSANSEIRQEALGDAKPALTVVIADIYNEQWLLEIEATAFQSI